MQWSGAAVNRYPTGDCGSIGCQVEGEIMENSGGELRTVGNADVLNPVMNRSRVAEPKQISAGEEWISQHRPPHQRHSGHHIESCG